MSKPDNSRFYNSPTAFTSLTDEWGTPKDLFDKLNEIYGFTLDVCASELNYKCEKYFTKEIDGLEQDWSKDVCWMNPPYGRDISKWMKKALDESLRGATVVCLVPSRTDTAWWHDFAVKGEITFLRGRVKFVSADGKATNPAPFASAIVVFQQRGEEVSHGKRS